MKKHYIYTVFDWSKERKESLFYDDPLKNPVKYLTMCDHKLAYEHVTINIEDTTCKICIRNYYKTIERCYPKGLTT